MTRRTAAGTGILVAAGFLLMQLAWLLTMPTATGIDEFDHIHRAASVGAGHWGYSHREIDPKEGRGGLIPVPKNIVAATKPACESFQYVGRANCSAYADAGGGLVEVACAAARYNPVFYAAIGYPAALFHGAGAITVMRLVTAALCAAMLALGAVAIRTWARTGWPLLGLFLAATPTVLYSTSIAAPNGLNIVSGLTLWAALLGLLYGAEDAGTRRLLLTISAISAVVLVNTHTLGILWLGLIVIAVAIQRGRRTLPRVPRDQQRPVLVALAGVFAGATFAAAWILLARTNNPWHEPDGGFHETWWHQVATVGLPSWPLQAIGAFPMRDEPAPMTVYAIGVTMMLSLAVIAVLALVRRRNVSSLLAIAFVAVMSYVVPIALTAMSFKQIGLAWQGRYQMAFTGGLLILFALALDRGRKRVPVPLVVSVMGLVALMNVLGQLRVIHKFDGSRLATAIGWHAPSIPLLGVLALGFTVLGVLGVVSLGRGQAEPEPSEPATPVPVVRQEHVGVPVP